MKTTTIPAYCQPPGQRGTGEIRGPRRVIVRVLCAGCRHRHQWVARLSEDGTMEMAEGHRCGTFDMASLRPRVERAAREWAATGRARDIWARPKTPRRTVTAS